MTQLANLLQETSDRQQSRNRCLTCKNPDWTRTIREFLDGILDRSVPPETTVKALYVLMSERSSELDPPVKPYTCAVRTLNEHIQRCERDRWQKVQAFRLGGSDSPDQ